MHSQSFSLGSQCSSSLFFSPPLFIVLLIFISHNVQGVLVDGKNREIYILIILLGSFSGILNYLYIV